MEKCRILLIDDDREDYLIMKEALQEIDEREVLEYAPTGLVALEMLHRKYDLFGSTPELIVLDINMPVLDGPSTLLIIRGDERFRDIPVVVYSESIHPQIERDCQNLGIVECIIKPTSIEEVSAVGRKLLALCNKSAADKNA